MPKKNIKIKPNFKDMLGKYISIRGLDIIVMLKNGETIELFKNRSIVNDHIVMFDKINHERKIPLSSIESIDLFAA